jgi:hypothetical protein
MRIVLEMQRRQNIEACLAIVSQTAINKNSSKSSFKFCVRFTNLQITRNIKLRCNNMTVSVMESAVLEDRLEDRFSGVSSNDEVLGDESLMLNSPVVEELSTAHIGKWNNLVSQTNWEKGALIISWRESLVTAGMPKAAYSDEAWSRRVGGISSQHVGRLRRVFERFGKQANAYAGLHWTHFQTALDWEDAEMWLEGAVQNSWSVAQMRIQRWEAIGAPEEMKPRNEDVFTAELDDDVNPRNDSFGANVEKTTEARIREIGAADIVDGFTPDDNLTQQNENNKQKKKQKKSEHKSQQTTPAINIMPTKEVLTSLKSATKLPLDFFDAIESFKIAIMNQKLSGWKEIDPETVLNNLDTLKALVVSREYGEFVNDEDDDDNDE